MLKASLIIEDYLNNNEVFNKKSSLNRDNTFDRYIKLKEELRKIKIDLSTSDLNNFEESNILVYVNVPKKILFIKEKFYIVFLVENKSIYPQNKNFKIINKFNLIFTWDDTLIDNIKFFKFNLSYSKEHFSSVSDYKKRNQFLNAIYSKKFQRYSLYEDRLKLIRFLEDKQGFDMFGVGWDEFVFYSYPFTIFNRFDLIKSLMKPLKFNLKNYKGLVKDKINLMTNYKFSLAFENNRFPGYITEKMFHPMMAGSIPIYYGAPNIRDHIPDNCFIAYDNFSNASEFWSFINNLSTKEIFSYRENIKFFLNSEAFKPFDSRINAKNITNIILKKYESFFQA